MSHLSEYISDLSLKYTLFLNSVLRATFIGTAAAGGGICLFAAVWTLRTVGDYNPKIYAL